VLSIDIALLGRLAIPAPCGIGVAMLGNRTHQSQRRRVVALHVGGIGIINRPSAYRDSKANGNDEGGDDCREGAVSP
jgi:hypothetical protein